VQLGRRIIYVFRGGAAAILGHDLRDRSLGGNTGNELKSLRRAQDEELWRACAAFPSGPRVYPRSPCLGFHGRIDTAPTEKDQRLCLN
jgi:hypothetical protein